VDGASRLNGPRRARGGWLPPGLGRRLAWLAVSLLLLGGFGPAGAEEGRLRVWLVLSEPGGAYAELARALEAGLSDRVELTTRVLESGESWVPAVKGGDLIVPVGLKAAQAVAQLDLPGPVLAALLPRQGYEALFNHGQAARRPVSALVLDQPWERQLALVRLALPKAERVGVLLGPGSQGQKGDLSRAAQQVGLRLNAATVSQASEVFVRQRELLRGNEVLLAVPDPLVLNPATLMSYLISAYRARVPIVGFSPSLAEAGALAAVYSTPEQIGRQLSELIVELAHGRSARPARLIYPRYFKVSVNRQVARSLELEIAPDDWLQRQLEARGDKS